jgi:hypothetical protein
MASHRSSVPLDSTPESIKTAFASHPILGTFDDEKRTKFIKILTDLHERATKGSNDKPAIASEEEWNNWRHSDVLDDMALFRFLFGYQWDVEFAANMAFEMLEWQKSFKPKDIRMKDIQKVARNAYLFHHGHDKKMRPILYMIIGNDKAENTDENVDLKFKHLVHTNEQCIKFIEKYGNADTYQILWIVELKNGSISLNLVKSMKGLFDLLGNRYPERCGQILVLNPPWTLNVIWSFLKPFLTQSQIDKYQFIKGSDAEIRTQLLKFIDEDQLIPTLLDYNGKADFTFDVDRIIQEEAQ